MAGIDSLIRGAVGSFAKDKAASFMTPSQMELARFALSPQAYLADKGITAVAQLLGYGNQYQELKTGAEDQKAYEKEVMRDSIGDMLPTAVGDFVRATPRMSDADYEASMEALRQSANTPEAANRYENNVRDMNYGTQIPGQGKYVGPLPEDNPIFDAQVSNLPYDLKSTPVSGTPEGFDPNLLASIMRGGSEEVGPQENYSQQRLDAEYDFGSDFSDYLGKPNGDIAPIDFGGTMDYGDMFGGGGGGKLEAMLQAQDEYKRGGQICGCKH